MTPVSHLVALALPVAFALTVLGSSAVNERAGRGPTVLTDREVGLGVRNDDRSIPEVWLGWSEPAGWPGAWLSRGALQALGFDFSVEAADSKAATYYRRQLARRAFVAFEINGPAWEAIVAERRDAEAAGERLPPGSRPQGSRLVPVDVDRDSEVLARRYTDVRTHLITAAVIAVRRFERSGGPPYVGVTLLTVDPPRIQVPVEFASALPVRGPNGNEAMPFSLSVMFGRRWEPWVVAVSPGPTSR